LKLWREIELAGDQIGRMVLRTPIIYSDILLKLTGKKKATSFRNLVKVFFAVYKFVIWL
jgi:hypothetical protein